MKTSIKGQNGSAKLKQAMSSVTIVNLNFRAEKRKHRAASIFPPSRVVIKGEWCTETPSFHTAILKKVSGKHIDIICFCISHNQTKRKKELLL